MITCKITLNNQPDIDYNLIMNKILSNGDFLISAEEDRFEVLFSCDKEEIDENYIRKALRKYKIDFMLHTYDYSDKLDLDTYTNQWVLNNLDRQLKKTLEKESQPGLRKIQKRLELLDKLVDETIQAKRKYEEQMAQIEENKKREDQNG